MWGSSWEFVHFGLNEWISKTCFFLANEEPLDLFSYFNSFLDTLRGIIRDKLVDVLTFPLQTFG
jgi:hypothetical protein